MNRNELIERFGLKKTNTKCFFTDRVGCYDSRILYTNDNGKLFVFYNNDLYRIRTFSFEPYVEGMTEIKGILGVPYSWFKQGIF